MNVRFIAFSITLVASASASLQPVLAAREGQARFAFSPSVFKLEQPRIPQEEYSMTPKGRPAMEGKVPQGPSFLGVDPQFLAKPVARAVPVARTQSTQVAMRPSLPPVSISSPFKPSFGAPSAPPQAAQPKMLPNFGSPSTLPQTSSTKAVAGKLVPHKASPSTSASKSVNAKLLPRRHAIGQPANPALALAKNIESYGKNFGYVPGAFLPVNSGSRTSTKADVFGRLLNRH